MPHETAPQPFDHPPRSMAQRLGAILWPSFFAAGVSTMVCFAMVDPLVLRDMTFPDLHISRETRTINAYGYQRGDIRGMPEYCITIGMKQILSAKRVYIALNREWQHGIARHVFNDPVQAQIPSSLLQNHPNTVFCAPESIGAGL